MIFLDSAATSFQKPPEVEQAVLRAMREYSSPGRGGYAAAVSAAEAAFQCRTELQELFHVSTPEQVAFTSNATHALNIAIKSLVPEGGSVVVSGYEHNAVTRPLYALRARVRFAGSRLFHPEEAEESFEKMIRPGLSAVICNHVSNVFGYVQPVEKIAALCADREVPFILDASQSAGVLPIDAERLRTAFLAMPGHKGLYGPQGTGVLICGEGTAVKPLIEGGTGSRSAQQEMPDFLPDRLEAGTHNMPGIAGLLAGVCYVRTRGAERICARERMLAAVAAEGLRQLPGVHVYAEPDLFAQTGVLSFTREGMDVEEIGGQLAKRGIAVRAGLHCAPAAHKSAGTLSSGTVRVSFSDWNTPEEIQQFLNAAADIFHAKS